MEEIQYIAEKRYMVGTKGYRVLHDGCVLNEDDLRRIMNTYVSHWRTIFSEAINCYDKLTTCPVSAGTILIGRIMSKTLEDSKRIMPSITTRVIAHVVMTNQDDEPWIGRINEISIIAMNLFPASCRRIISLDKKL